VLVKDGNMILDSCDISIVLAPLADGLIAPELAAAGRIIDRGAGHQWGREERRRGGDHIGEIE
jgi:hypothetical protein